AGRQVLEAALDERRHLVAPRLGEDEPGMVAVMLQERVAVARQAEEVRLLLGPLHLVPLVGAEAVDDLVLGVERLARGAVPAGVAVLGDVPPRLDLREERLDAPAVTGLRGAEKVVVRDAERVPQRL